MPDKPSYDKARVLRIRFPIFAVNSFTSRHCIARLFLYELRNKRKYEKDILAFRSSLISYFVKLDLWLFRSILRAPSLPVRHSRAVQNSPDNVIANTRQIRHPAAADHHNRVFLQIVANSRDIGGHFHPVGEPHAGNFPKRRIGLFGSSR